MKVYIATTPGDDGEGDTILGVYDCLERAMAANSPRVNTHWERRLYRYDNGAYYQVWDSAEAEISEHDVVTEGLLWERPISIWAEGVGKLTPDRADTLFHR